MGNIIASTYEINREIGSGGGGVVYLGNHLRLNKPVVLKADKRTLSTPEETLRREVDALKDLTHTYIPKVYDFVVQDGVVYTVMDYIEGESLDKPLKRGERFPQAQVISWACQLLEALCYLHGRPPYGMLHGDIKPANIMRTPQGDIRLIDFNIALALGEEGAVRVGFSRGYASPEHYGLDYSSSGATTRSVSSRVPGRTSSACASTEIISDESGSTGRRTILLDVRSDIYSLGATLYHLFTGRRPAQDAKQIQPITPADGVSNEVAKIIHKAMAPAPEDRYQSAEEMLYAFAHLHENDERTIRHKRHMKLAAGLLIALFLAGGLSTFIGLKQMERAQELERIAAETSEKALAAVSASERAYQNGDIPGAVRQALAALELESDYLPQAQKALTDALGVYELSDAFQPYRALPLPSAPLKMALSPEGSRAAALVSGRLLLFDMASGEQTASLPADASALSDVVFAGEDRVLYAGEGALRAYDLSAGTELWAGNPATSIALSSDGTTAAAVYKDEKEAAVYDAQTGRLLRTVSFDGRSQRVIANDVFADPEDNLFALSGDGRYLAVSFSNGGLDVFDLRGGDMDVTVFDETAYSHFEGGFYRNYLAFSATEEGSSVFAVIDMETVEQTGGFESPNQFHVRADENGILVSTENLLVDLHPVTGEQTELAYANADITGFVRAGGYTLVSLSDGTTAFYDQDARLLETREGECGFLAMAGDFALTGNADTPSLRALRLERHPEAQVFRYDREDVHDEARMSGDGNVMLYRYDGFRLYSPDGSLLEEVAFPDGGQVYDQQYRREESGDYLEVFYNDGTVRAYSAADGRLLSGTRGTPPDRSLDEEFLTDKLRITAPLHGAAEAYDRETGELIRTLEKDDYLTYVTQVGEYIITEYVTSQGARYGLLLDGSCQTLARLPELCDILPDGTLLFDDQVGNLRESRIYSMQELIALAKQ